MWLLGHLVSGSSWQEMTGEETHSEVCRGYKQATTLPLTALESTLSIIFCIPGFSFMCLCVCVSDYKIVDAKDI